MQQIHCVNDQSTVTRILSHGITKLLDRLYRVVGQDSAPAIKIGGGKVPIVALDGRDTQLRNLGKNITNLQPATHYQHRSERRDGECRPACFAPSPGFPPAAQAANPADQRQYRRAQRALLRRFPLAPHLILEMLKSSARSAKRRPQN